jgi:hypothetical protein
VATRALGALLAMLAAFLFAGPVAAEEREYAVGQV